MAQQVALTTFILQTQTNADGYFQIAHGLNQNTYQIQGINVAIRHSNGNWHTIDVSHIADNRFWWNDTTVQGMIAHPDRYFANRPVRIIIFALYNPF